MPRQSQSKHLIQELQDWDDEALEDLSAMIRGLLEARLEAQQTQVEEEVEKTREDGTPVGRYGGRGHIELKMIPDAKTGRVYGPYRYLRYWGVTRKGTMGLKSVYLGKGTQVIHN